MHPCTRYKGSMSKDDDHNGVTESVVSVLLALCCFNPCVCPLFAALISLLLRSYFLYTPLLPACATGTVEERSIIEPVRKVLGTKVSTHHFCCYFF